MLSFKKKDEGNILELKRNDQYHTVDELAKHSHPNSKYYTLLILSALIIAAGLLIGNSAIVIGGMLVTPVLTPILLFSLGIATLEPIAVYKAGVLAAASFLTILIISWILAYFFGTGEQNTFLTVNAARAFQLYFIIAFASGVAATFAWARREMTDVLPGVAMALSLVPPISLVGISFSSQQIHLAEFYFYVFVSNLIGLVFGSLIVFILLKFYKTKKEVEKEV